MIVAYTFFWLGFAFACVLIPLMKEKPIYGVAIGLLASGAGLVSWYLP